MKLEQGTWLDPEELAYSSPTGAPSSSQRRAGALCADGKVRTFKVGVPDTYYTIPALGRIGGRRVSGFVSIDDGTLTFTETRGNR